MENIVSYLHNFTIVTFVLLYLYLRLSPSSPVCRLLYSSSPFVSTLRGLARKRSHIHMMTPYWVVVCLFIAAVAVSPRHGATVRNWNNNYTMYTNKATQFEIKIMQPIAVYKA